jgi:hypothetical protein
VKRHKPAGIAHIPVEYFQARGRRIHFEIHKLIDSTWNKEELRRQWKKPIILVSI